MAGDVPSMKELLVGIEGLAPRPGGRVAISDVHPFLVTLGRQAQFPAGDGRGFMRLHAHLPSEYLRAATGSGLVVRSCEGRSSPCKRWRRRPPR